MHMLENPIDKKTMQVCCVMSILQEFQSAADTPKSFIHLKHANHAARHEQESSRNCNVAYLRMNNRRMDQATGNRIMSIFSSVKEGGGGVGGVWPKDVIR